MKSNILSDLSEQYLFNFFIVKVLIATVCGMMIGWERELKHKAAGIRTNVLVSVGSCMLTAVSFLISDYYDIDPTRIISQIITGIGFIGGAVVYKTADKVTGVTTATFIWVMCAIGILAGIGLKLLPIILTIVILVISIIFRKLEDKIHDFHEPH